MSNCFRREILTFQSDENFIQGCYLITMENSKRRENYMKQLSKYRPFHEIHIIHNKGFKYCKKEPRIKNTADDLSDVYAKIFQECLYKNKKNVLIFEDDFFFTESYENIRNYMNEIRSFLEDNPRFMTYNLGAIPLFMFPVTSDMNHYMYKGSVAHSVIYSQRYMAEYVKQYKTMNCLSDCFWNKYHENYTFHKPICFQLFPKTENSQNWTEYIPIHINIQEMIALFFHADLRHDIFFPAMYSISKIFYIFLFLLLIKTQIKELI